MQQFSTKGMIFSLLVILHFLSCEKEKTGIRGGIPPDNRSIDIPTTITEVCKNSRGQVNAQLLPVGTLSEARSNIAVASEGNKVLFAGGQLSHDVYSSRVDIFDLTTNSWTTAELSQPRSQIATAVLGKKIFFAGGAVKLAFSSRVDIYNTETNSWATMDLGPKNATMAGASAGGKVVFASGATADIFDGSTNTWSTARLSERPGEGYCCQEGVGGIMATAIGNTIYFAGGEGWDVHQAIDIYNTTTNTWTKSNLIEYKGFGAGIAVGNTNYWAGGETYNGGYFFSNKVEIWNTNTGERTIDCLFQPNFSFSAVQKNNSIVFFTGREVQKDKFDIYDITTKTWSIGLLSQTMEEAGIVSVNNTVYVAGGKEYGSLSKNVYKLGF